MKTLLPIAAAGAPVALTGAAFADTSVSAVTDLNVRAGPGSQYPVIGVLKAGQQATLSGCLQNGKWCTVVEAGGQGWVYSDYVSADFGGSNVVLSQRPADSNIAVVEAPRVSSGDAGALAGGATGAIAGAIIGGPCRCGSRRSGRRRSRRRDRHDHCAAPNGPHLRHDA